MYTRNVEFLRETLGEVYYGIESELKAIVLRDGLEVMLSVEKDI